MLDPLALVALDLGGSLGSSQPLTLEKPFSSSHQWGQNRLVTLAFIPSYLPNS